MWQLIVCAAVAWGGCQYKPPVYFGTQYLCEQKAAQLKHAYCKEVDKKNKLE